MIAAAWAWIRANRALAASAAVLALIVVAWGAWLLAVHLGEKRGAAKVETANAQAATAAQIDNTAIADALAFDRQKTDAALADANRRLKEADDHEADSRPSPARVAYLCGVLRSQAGARVSDLPARCRSVGGAGTQGPR